MVLTDIIVVLMALLIFILVMVWLCNTESTMSDIYDSIKRDELKISYDYGKIDAYRDIMTFLNENVNAWEADYFDKLYSKFEGFDKPIQLRRSDFFKMALDSTIKIRKIMEKELEERCKKTYKDMEQYIDFKGENNGETSK